MRKIGVHIRLSNSLEEAAQRAIRLQIPIFQCFFIEQLTNQFISLTDEEIKNFVQNWQNKFENLYLHGSYWLNLAGMSPSNYLIKREFELARRLSFSHIIIHPGSSKRGISPEKAIRGLARSLNSLLKYEDQITIVLENAAHGGRAIGGDLHDFLALRQQLNHPEKVLFCIDTAHAFSYGYDIASSQGREEFFLLIEKTIGFANIALIHLNDTNQKCGSRIDKHEAIGNGLLSQALPLFLAHPLLKTVPVILELPIMSEQEERAILDLVEKW